MSVEHNDSQNSYGYVTDYAEQQQNEYCCQPVRTHEASYVANL